MSPQKGGETKKPRLTLGPSWLAKRQMEAEAARKAKGAPKPRLVPSAPKAAERTSEPRQGTGRPPGTHDADHRPSTDKPSQQRAPRGKSEPPSERVPTLQSDKRKPGRPKVGEQRDKPWLAAGMSRRTWYRRQREAAK